MNEINRVLGKAAWRLGFINFLRGLVVALAALLAAAILLRVVEQLLGFTQTAATRIPPGLPGAESQGLDSAWMWKMVAYYGSGAAVLAALVWAVVQRPRPLVVARRVDEGANLKESLSTALCVSGQKDPWSRAAVESATRIARGVNVGAAVPIQPPRFWPVTLALGLSLAVVFLALPKLDVMGYFASSVARKEKEVQIITAKREVSEVQKKIEEITAKIPTLEKEKALEASPDKPEPQTAEEIRKAMVQQLARKTEQLEDLRTGTQAQKLQAMQERLRQLKQPGAETSELAKALAKADFKAAQQELQNVKDKLAANSDMSEADKQKLAEQLEKLAEQMKQLAENQQGLEKALEQAGIPKEALASKDALQKALQENKNLSQQQKEALQKLCEGGMECKSGMSAMAEAMDKMAQSAKSGEQGQQGEQGASSMSEQLSELEALQQELDMADAAMSECQNAMAKLGKDGDCDGMGECSGGGNGMNPGNGSTGKWSAGWNDAFGNGRGGPGLGRGGNPGEARADFTTEKKKSIGAKGDGPIVSTKLVEGESIRGESRAEFARVVAGAEQNAAEAIENNTIPREYHDAIKSYFGRLKSKASAQNKDAPAPPAAEPAKDADQ